MSDVEIVCRENGPFRVFGKVVLKDADGNVFDLTERAGREFISLCRCGHSGKKPFCDGSHKTAGFESIVHPAKSTSQNV